MRKCWKILIVIFVLTALPALPAPAGEPMDDLKGILAGLDLSEKEKRRVLPMTSGDGVETFRGTYSFELRMRVFDAARHKLQTTMPEKMPYKVQPKVMAIRMRLRKGGPPSVADRNRIRMAVMERTRPIMSKNLHDIADSVSKEAMKDDNLITGALAVEIAGKLSEEKAAELAAALEEAGISADESRYLQMAEQQIEEAIDAYEPDITGIVDSMTGEVIVKDEDL